MTHTMHHQSAHKRPKNRVAFNTHQQGFTLIEVMVAMVIFAMLSVVSYQVFDSLNRAKNTANRHALYLSDLQYAYIQVQNDVRHITAWNSKHLNKKNSNDNSENNNDNQDGSDDNETNNQSDTSNGTSTQKSISIDADGSISTNTDGSIITHTGANNMGNNPANTVNNGDQSDADKQNDQTGNDNTSDSKQTEAVIPYKKLQFMSLKNDTLSFIRFADSDPRFKTTPTFTKVNYVFKDGTLSRNQQTTSNIELMSNSTDASNSIATNNPATNSVLLTDVENLRWLALLPEEKPVFSSQDTDEDKGQSILPKGIKVTFTYHGETIEWIFAVPQSSPLFEQ